MTLRALLLALVSLASLHVTPPARAAQSPASAVAGTWEGSLDVGAATLRLLFNLSVDAGGQLSGTVDSPDQGAYGLVLDTATFNDGTLRCELKRIAAVFEGRFDPANRTIAGQWQQLGRSYPLALRPGTPVRFNRPQEPNRPYPYSEEEVSYENTKAGVELAGTLTKPRSGGPFAAVLLITGSGAQNRNEELMGHKPFLVLADDLTRRGIAVLRVDDRGVGGSSGNMADATSEDFVKDALAGVAFLKSRADIDSKHIGLIGHSEGAMIAAAAAARSKDVAFVVMLSGPGVKGADILQEQAKLIGEAAGVPPGILQFNLETQRQLLLIAQQESSVDSARTKLAALWAQRKKEAQTSSALSDIEKNMIANGNPAMEAQIKALTSPWMRYFLSYDPAAALRAVRVPVLAVNGSLDLQVSATQNVPPIKTALEAAGNPNSKVVLLPNLNHLLQNAVTGSPAEYQTIEETISPPALKTVGEWVIRQTSGWRPW